MGTGVHGDVWLVEGHAFPPQLGLEVILRVLLFVPLLTEHFPGGAEQEPQAVQLVNWGKWKIEQADYFFMNLWI